MSVLFGGDGDDILYGSEGAERLYGDFGDKNRAIGGDDIIYTGVAGGDKVVIKSVFAGWGNDKVYGQSEGEKSFAL